MRPAVPRDATSFVPVVQQGCLDPLAGTGLRGQGGYTAAGRGTLQQAAHVRIGLKSEEWRTSASPGSSCPPDASRGDTDVQRRAPGSPAPTGWSPDRAAIVPGWVFSGTSSGAWRAASKGCSRGPSAPGCNRSSWATAMLPGEVRHSRPHAPASLTLLMATGAVSQVYPLNRSEILIGRSEQSDIALADPGVSRNHARIIREGDDFIVEDLRSTNGTEVNGQPIRRRRLADGDVVKLANSTLQFRREG